MEYFCYVSRSKIDQLYNTLSLNKNDEEVLEKRISENSFNSDIGADWSIAHIINLFKGKIAYGRKGVIQRERKVKLHYVEKLKCVLLAIAKEDPIPSLITSIESNSFKSLFYHFNGKFKISNSLVGAEFDSKHIITIHTSILNKKLYLDCSLRFFSEGNEPNEKFAINSYNFRFFSGKIELAFETIFLLQTINKNEIFGTPLYLKIIPSLRDQLKDAL